MKKKTVKKRAAAHTAPRPARTPVMPESIAPRVSGDLSAQLTRLFTDGVLIDLSIGWWTALKRNTSEDLGIISTAIPEFVVGIGMKRLIPKALVDRWTAIAGTARYIVRKHSMLFPVGESAFVPLRALGIVDKELTRLQAEFYAARDALVEGGNYDTIRNKMLDDYPGHRAALSALYPSRDAVASRFYFTWSVYTVALPKRLATRAFDEKLTEAREAAQQKYQRELEDRVQGFLTESVTALRAKTVELCQTITSKIVSGEVITNRSLTTLREFIDKFRMMNFAGDDEIERRLEKLKTDVLGGVDADALTDETLRRTVQTSLEQITAIAADVTDVSSVTGGYHRRIITE